MSRTSQAQSLPEIFFACFNLPDLGREATGEIWSVDDQGGEGRGLWRWEKRVIWERDPIRTSHEQAQSSPILRV